MVFHYNKNGFHSFINDERCKKMKTLVIYESFCCNTKKIAEEIGSIFIPPAKVISVEEIHPDTLKHADFVVVGSPIFGWQPSERTSQFLSSLQEDTLAGKKAASFDTRVKLFIHGEAAIKIASALKKAGAQIVGKPGAFFVKGKEGPMIDGEIEKAKEWAKKIQQLAQ